MESLGAALRKAFVRPLEKSPKQPSALDWLVWRLFFSRWDKLIEQNPRLAREMYRTSRAWFFESPLAPRPQGEPHGESQSQEAARRARLSTSDFPSAQFPAHPGADSGAQTEFPDFEQREECLGKVAPMVAAKDKAATSRLRPPRQNPQSSQAGSQTTV